VTSFKWGLIAAVSALVISLLTGILSGVGAGFIILRALIFAVVFFGIGFGVRFVINSYFPDFFLVGGGADDYQQTDSEQAESRINITLDNTGEYAVPELFKTPDDPREMGNIDDLLSGAFRARSSSDGFSAYGKGLDGGKEEGYNITGAGSDFSYGEPGLSTQFPSEEIPYLESDPQESSNDSAPAARAVFTPSFGDGGGLGGLPDLDMMAKAFSSFGAGPSSGHSAPAGASTAGSAPQDMAFMPADMEEAVAPSAPRQNKGNKPEPMKGDFSPKELAEGIRSVLSKDK